MSVPAFMSAPLIFLTTLRHCLLTACSAFFGVGWLILLAVRPRAALAAENLFLRKQLALFRERNVKPHRASDATRWLMAAVSRVFDWPMALVVVKPDTLIRWHRKGFRLFWRWKSKPTGRPRLPKDLRRLIREMAVENPTWGEERIANELKLKLGIRVSPRTVEKYLRVGGPVRTPEPKQRWLTFVHNHARVIVAADFFVVVTASFRILYVLVIVELGTRRILHHNVTAHPTAEWTLQQFREALPADHPYRFVIHDRDSIFSRQLDRHVTDLGVRVLRTPIRAPRANAICERLGGSLRRECLDFLIPLNERHLKMTVKQWTTHYNRRRPHSSLGPGFPEPNQESVPSSDHRHKLPAGYRVVKRAVLGGLHHEYSLVKEAA
jgi:transposase InsO family protein